jgi:hypothetical protein
MKTFFKVVLREVLMHRGCDGPLYVHHIAYDICNVYGKTVRSAVQPAIVDDVCASLNVQYDALHLNSKPWEPS